MERKQKKIEEQAGTLFVVATPIGNLGDLTHRAAATLEAVDFIAAEDTRVTIKLLNHLGIKKPMVSCYRHNEDWRTGEIVARIEAGESCALCCDAGTPAVSDPGEELVAAAKDAGITVVPIPGPSAAIAALSASGLYTGRFCFEGFIPVNKKTRRERFLEIKDERRTLIVYEAPHKLKNTLVDMLEYFGDREITVARELTKIHEEIVRTTLSEAASHYKKNEPKGEFVLIVAGKEPEELVGYTMDDAVALANAFIKEGKSLSAAAKEAATETGFPRSDIYKAVLRDSDVGAGE